MLIGNQIDEMLALTARAGVRNTEVSNWSVGQQIEHCSLTMRSTAAAMRQTRSESTQLRLTIVGRRVFEAGLIARGRGESPPSVRVDTQPSPEELMRSLSKARSAVENMDPDAKTGYFQHPFFGVLDPGHVVRFLEIHNEHHLAIIRDILAG